MAGIETFSGKEASGGLAKAYEEILDHPMTPGRVPNIIRCMGQRPEAVLQVWPTNMKITFGASTLGRVRMDRLADGLGVELESAAQK